MARGISFRGTRKKLAVAAAAAGLVIAFSGQAQAADYEATTKDKCAWVGGAYDYYRTGTVSGHPLYNTSWNFTIFDRCTDGKGAGLYTTYWKWENGGWWFHDYTKLGSDSNGNNYDPGYAEGSGSKVDEVKLYVCLVGDKSSCVALF
ncbi:Tat pathway signal protein [Streptomyces sp. NPDC006872]|uniref:Tat pathway signal protein n=1 Tax=Streptomyces sp. NPDC006872 TaxID=3155720 RepID=UPI00340230C0